MGLERPFLTFTKFGDSTAISVGLGNDEHKSVTTLKEYVWTNH
jgi:hypothetical protein